MHAFPAFFPLAGRTVVVAGEGEAADAKARLFEGSHGKVACATQASEVCLRAGLSKQSVHDNSLARFSEQRRNLFAHFVRIVFQKRDLVHQQMRAWCVDSVLEGPQSNLPGFFGPFETE